MYKLLKLTKLLRIFKIIKDRNRLAKYFRSLMYVSIYEGIERFIFSQIGFIFLVHIVSCMWVLIAQFEAEDEKDESWMVDYKELPSNELYLVSIYWTITTITTVGYGDISAGMTIEYIYSIIIMFTGIIAFSFASAALTSFFDSYDTENAIYKEKLAVLNKIL